MCKAPVPIARTPEPEPEPIKEATAAEATNTKASAIERGNKSTLGGRDNKTGARGLSDEAKNKKKTLLGE